MLGTVPEVVPVATATVVAGMGIELFALGWNLGMQRVVLAAGILYVAIALLTLSSRSVRTLRRVGLPASPVPRDTG